MSNQKQNRWARCIAAGALALSLAAGTAAAKEVNIQVWVGGSPEQDLYRIYAIEMAADILSRQAKINGEELNIKVDGKAWNTWDDFKQAVLLAAESGTAPHIIVSGHEDIAPWSQAGIIRVAEKYIDFDSWPLNSVFPNLIDVASYEGAIYAVPQDAESRPFFFWIPHMKAIGYSDADIEALPERVRKGDYTLQNVLEDAKKIQDAGLVEPGYGFYPRVANGPDYWQFYQSFGGEMQDRDSGKLVLDTGAMERFYQFFVDAVDRGVTRKNHIGTPWDQWYSEVARGKAGIWHGGTWHYSRYTGKEQLEDFFGTIQFTLIPAGDDGVGRANTITHPLMYMISNRGSEDDAFIAAELIKIASEPLIQSLHAINSAHLGISTVQQSLEFYANDPWASVATERLLTYANAMPNHTEFGQYWTIMWKWLETAWSGQATAKDAVAEAVEEAKNAIGDSIIIR